MDENGQYRSTKCCCFICSRIKLGKLIEEKIRDIHELLENVPHLEDSIAIPVNKRGGVLRIGVWGMGGEGKTTIMSEIHNCLVKGNSLYNCIIWVVASNDLNKVQQDIAVKLGLNFNETDDQKARASKLLETFNRRKTFALILDDVWEPFSIEEVGIPVLTTENGCKLVIITRSRIVCRDMEREEDVELKLLLEDEAWNLFKDKAGELVLSDLDVQSIVMEAVKQCCGLPLAIVAVGRALRNTTDIIERVNALEEFKRSSIDIYNVDEVLRSRLKLSYSKLKNDARRTYFLFCALYSKGHLIEENELINYWVWEDLLGGVSMVEMKRKGQMIVCELISACL
ncbi:probable disease resistance protein At1g15890 [Neltuma alba]|uniref:probable disease resistance protein At1g15890 n=1 Tax=Neltuma alba TaxID=207710 RepID=UPI0010A53844|nr:probable disease resistance protein At1g15890 [Prosopis alba]XP_028766518.1 probable disease resistance protein At1g15890 [Prosopis alba]XP_028777860.1 probable disease resistance protein At1g15890 [Prosopis alba]